MPSGTKKNRMAGLNYSYMSPDHKRSAEGNILYEGSTLDSYTSTNRANFFSSSNTYDYSFAKGYNKNIRISTAHNASLNFNRVSIKGSIDGYYNKETRQSQSISASFMQEQADITMRALEVLYDGNASDRLSSVINRSVTLSNGETKEARVNAHANTIYKLPRFGDIIRLLIRAKYNNNEEHIWNDYSIYYGDKAYSGERRRHYTDNSPSHNFDITGEAAYMCRLNNVSLNFIYRYNFHDRVLDSYMYALERLVDMGIYGSLPYDYAASLDPGNSFRSDLNENRHAVIPAMQYNYVQKNNNRLFISLRPEIGLLHSHLNYSSDNKFYPIQRSSMVATVAQFGGQFLYETAYMQTDRTRHYIGIEYFLDTDTPELHHMVDVTNTSDPLNISLGNPDLKNAYKHHVRLRYKISPAGLKLNNALTIDYYYTSNALVRGYYYDMTTGARYNKTYNVNGNNTLSAADNFSLQFGNIKQFTLSSVTEAAYQHNVDMVGTESMKPVPSKVNTRTIGEDLRLSWQIGKQSICLNGKITNRHTYSSRKGLSNIDATHYKYGITGQFVLPAGFSVSTDFTLYTRRGYGVIELDSTDAVWNTRLSYTPLGGQWVFNLDGFDLLHRLSNVHYSITATGRTITYTNTLPRYILASVQYRFSVSPKKR